MGKIGWRLALAVVLVVASHTVFAADAAAPFSVLGQVTYGSYGGSVERKSITSETGSFSYNPSSDFGATINANHNDLIRKEGLDNIGTTSGGATLFKFFDAGPGLLGGRATAVYVSSDDRNSDHTLIPYVSLMFKTRDQKVYFDVGYANSGYRDATVNQYTATAGFSLFKDWLYSQTRVYYIDLSRNVEGRGNAFSVEERLSYYAVPKKLTLSLYGLLGRRIFAYDPDLGIVYNLPDYQHGSVGFTASYNITPTLVAFGDVTYEAYRNNDISNSYHATYGTVGLKYGF